MSRVAVTLTAFAISLLIVVVGGCTFVIPESQPVPSNATHASTSNVNITMSVQSLGERQRYSLNPFVSYTAKEGYILAIYDVNVTSLDGTNRVAVGF